MKPGCLAKVSHTRRARSVGLVSLPVDAADARRSRRRVRRFDQRVADALPARARCGAQVLQVPGELDARRAAVAEEVHQAEQAAFTPGEKKAKTGSAGSKKGCQRVVVMQGSRAVGPSRP